MRLKILLICAAFFILLTTVLQTLWPAVSLIFFAFIIFSIMISADAGRDRLWILLVSLAFDLIASPKFGLIFFEVFFMQLIIQLFQRHLMIDRKRPLVFVVFCTAGSYLTAVIFSLIVNGYMVSPPALIYLPVYALTAAILLMLSRRFRWLKYYDY